MNTTLTRQPAPRLPRPAARRPLRVLVVDDSPFMQRRMTELLEAAGEVTVVGTARDGAEAIRRSAELQPEVITMDIHMPRMDGLVAIDHIMRHEPRPIVVVSSFVRSGSAAAIAALERGAVDLVQKPSEGGISLDLASVAGELLGKVRQAARVRVVRSGRASDAETAGPEVARRAPVAGPEAGPAADSVVLIGSSTGGPAALLDLSRRWRGAKLPAILVAQHLPAEFTGELAKQMAAHFGGVVREAVTGDRPRDGEILIAPGGHHLVLEHGGAARLIACEAHDRAVPSVDRLFESASAAFGPRVLGVVLTGMGNDGTAGAAAIRRGGGTVWAQDEASSVIDGMPRAVRKAGHASRVLGLKELGEGILLMAAADLPT
ncbi:MAG: chemotaxis-specific protein-glutamate methyltransferase CheB [Verrucomicrobia bacterium]|nr:chemotaxis-specific protein-glutamate methyltransferase CheB [Verrucomicrobiota bacterium]